MEVNLADFKGQEVNATRRDGLNLIGLVRGGGNPYYPFSLQNISYTAGGRFSRHELSSEDIVSIKLLGNSGEKMKNKLGLEQYAGKQVRLTVRDGTQAEGQLSYSSEAIEENWPFLFIPKDEGDNWETYTECGRVNMLYQNPKDIMSVEALGPVEEVGKGIAVEKMALTLLPDIFSSLKSDPNLEEALEKAIRGTILAMFGDDITGETLNRFVAVIKSHIYVCLKQ